MKYDIPLKTIKKNRRSSLRSALGIQGEWRELPGNFPAREDEVDFLGYVKNGRRRAYFAHVEFQSDRHPDMLTRMFSYRGDIRNWQQTSGDKACKGLGVVQTVVYIGPGSWSPKLRLKQPQIDFGYGYLDVKTLDSDLLFASENVEDAALAVLFRNGHKPYMMRTIVQRVAQASKSESETLNAGALLTSFSRLRRADEIVAMEWRKKMNLPVNFEDSPLMKESYDRVRAETDANRLIAVITETLQRKLPNDVPPDLNGRLTALSVDELDAMFKRSIDAKSADDILTVPSPSTSLGH
jgi:hypothetical protein